MDLQGTKEARTQEEGDGPVGKACLYVRSDDGAGRRELFDATPPVLDGFAAQHGFAF